MSNEYLYKRIDIWKKIDDKTWTRYKCYEVLSLGKFFVTGQSYYRKGFDDVEHKTYAESFFEILFLDGLEGYIQDAKDTIEEAIAEYQIDMNKPDEDED